MRITLLSDVHAQGRAHPAQAAFVRLLSSWDSHVFVLCGDIFDAWWGFSRAIPGDAAPVIAAWMALRARGVRVVWVRGNRDFAAGGFVESLGVEVVDAWHTEVQGFQVVAAHGDIADRRWRARLAQRALRSEPARRLAEILGPERTWTVAEALGRRSRVDHADPQALVAAQQAWARARFAEGVQRVFLGHTHTRGVDALPGGTLVRLGSFGDHGDLTVLEDGEIRQLTWG